MRHRGPDSDSALVHADAGVVFEACRLAIIDPQNSEADQPFCDRSGRWVLVYNGEIFNFRALRGDLERSGVRFRTASDTEVLLEALIRDGEAVVPRLRGMFAFALWDRETGELLAARDQVGVKPLYYMLKDGLFVAASELRTLIAHPGVRPVIDAESVVEYLAFGHTAGDRTLLRDIRKLPPGHLLRIRNGELDVKEYWDVLPPEDPPDSEAIERDLLHQLDEAVAAALVSDVPVALMLSGGLDSSAVAALAVRHVDASDLTAYSVAFGLPDDESAAARRLASDLGIRHREIRLTETALAEGFEEWLAGIDEPSSNPTWVAVSAIARAAHEDGIKVLLSGDGGDELFGGYNRWMKYLRFHDQVWRRSPRTLRRIAGSAVRPLARGLAGDIARRAAHGGDLFVGSRPFHDDLLERCLGANGKTAAAARPPETYVEQLRRRFDERHPSADYLAWMSYAALKTDLVEDYLARLDKMGMRESVEGRVPLLDPHLARWAFRLSQEQKVDGFQQKALFRRVVTPLLPDYVTRRPKQGFCPPVATWATQLIATRANNDSALIESGIVAPNAFRRLRDDRSPRAAFALWTLGTLAAWCDANL